MKNALTLEMLNAAIATAEARYLASAPTDKAGNPLTSSADLRKARKFVDDKVIAYVGNKVDADALCKAIAETMPVKATMRMCEFFSACSAGNYQQLDAVTVLSILSAVNAGASARDAVTFAVTGKGDDSTSDIVKNTALVRKLQSVCAKVGVTTAPTQLSRSFGVNGFCRALGIGQFERNESGTRELVKIYTKNPFYKRVASLIDDATEGTLELMKGMKKKNDDK